MTRLKALSVIQCRDYILETRGPEGVELVKAAMAPDARDAVHDLQLLPIDWIEVGYGFEHSAAYDRVFGTGDGRAAQVMVGDVTRKHMTGLYRSVLSASDAKTILERSSRLWSRYYDRGESQMVWLSETSAIKRILGCPDMPLHHEWLTNPYFEELMRLCQAQDIEVEHVKCVATGGDCCDTLIRWRMDSGGGGDSSMFRKSTGP